MLFTEQFPHHRAAEIARAVQRGARFIEAMFLGESYANDKLNLKVIPYPSRQRNDGSWYGCWGNCFTYGCWFGVEGKNQQPLGKPNSSMISLSFDPPKWKLSKVKELCFLGRSDKEI